MSVPGLPQMTVPMPSPRTCPVMGMGMQMQQARLRVQEVAGMQVVAGVEAQLQMSQPNVRDVVVPGLLPIVVAGLHQ